MLDKLKYPIGKFTPPNSVSKQLVLTWISTIEEFPLKLTKLVELLDDDQLNTIYRPEGWSIKQVVHHCADSHLNSYIRFKWALTENTPIIKPYIEDKWAELFDSTSAPIDLSLNLITALHSKWVYLLKGLSKQDLDNQFIHPGNNETISLSQNIGIYAWHCNHHYAHIFNLIQSKNW